jgi:hypothetical protein
MVAVAVVVDQVQAAVMLVELEMVTQMAVAQAVQAVVLQLTAQHQVVLLRQAKEILAVAVEHLLAAKAVAVVAVKAQLATAVIATATATAVRAQIQLLTGAHYLTHLPQRD